MRIMQFKQKILLFFLYLLPFADILNGYMIRRANIFGIGKYFHFLLLFVFCFAYLSNKMKLKKYEICTLLLAFTFAISAIVNEMILDNFQSISLERVTKIISNVISFTCIIYFLKNDIISHEKFEKYLIYLCIVIPFISLFANVLSIGNYTYSYSKLGMTGFFTGSNEPVAVYMILNIFLVYKLCQTNKNIYLIPFAINEINLIYAQSKSSYLGAIIFAFFVFIILIKNKRKIDNKRIIENKKKNFAFLFAGIALLLGSIKVVSKNISKFASRQKSLIINYNNTNFFNYISSGRMGRFDKLFYPIFDRNILVVFFQMLFGQGLNFGFYEIYEIDILDTFLYGGFIAMYLIIIFMIFIIHDIWKALRSKIMIILVLFLFFFSCTAGHLWTGGMSGTYFALVCSFLMFEKQLDKPE